VKAIILGSAAGGGVPQWNCRCPVCRLAWSGDPRIAPRTQSSLAVSADGETWLVLNASPDIRQQIGATPELQPCAVPPAGQGSIGRGSVGSAPADPKSRERMRGVDGRAQAFERAEALRDSPIAAVLVTNGDVDHVAGLLCLRERQGFTLFGTAETLGVVAANRIFDVLDPGLVRREPIELGRSREVLPGLETKLFAVPGKAPLWLEGPAPDIGGESESTVGVILSTGGRRIAYVPGCAAVSPTVLDHIEGADILFFDGTLWQDDEMIAAGIGADNMKCIKILNY